jgi:uncharacterized protein YbcC (UPF0753/DUF2309 family)
MKSVSKHKPYPSFNPFDAVELAAKKIAPTWPLDQSIAVNPWWHLRNMDMAEASSKLRCLGNIRMLMPKDYYKSLWLTEVTEQHLNEAKKQLDVTAETEELVTYLDSADSIKHWLHISDFLDDQESHQYKISWREEVLQQISNFCAFDLQHNNNVDQHPSNNDAFYKAWRASAIADKGMQILTGEENLSKLFARLPENADDLVAQHLFDLTDNNIDAVAWNDYVYALALDINGWASWLAYDEWQADLYEREHQHLLRQLVVIRMAWDWVLWQNTLITNKNLFTQLNYTFNQQLANAAQMQLQCRNENRWLWVWHKACEIKFQETMQQKLVSAISQPIEKPVLQAVFCIDVRSAQYRSQLEVQHADIETYGFAGFFGLPIAYSSAVSKNNRPQLPGLLRPTLVAQQVISTVQSNKASAKLQKKMSWKIAADSSAASFGIVESQGLLKIFDLLKRSLFGSSSTATVLKKSDYEWLINSETADLNTEDLAALTKAILNGIGLKTPYAPSVLIVGHGSLSSNNPHASALDCGACGGQSGEVNASVLCYLLNRKDIREALHGKGMCIPDTTTFVPCLHNTVTDEVIVLNEQDGAWLSWLQAATTNCQQRRAVTDPQLFNGQQDMQRALSKRSQDWAQLRPEWGLANNAAFVVAPRAHTRGIDFEGRSFLHDYTWQTDNHFELLEQIMTAPMIVTNWINLQYYASVTDNQHYGSGNKMLHNVVSGNFGVFEGNGGDLRIGLPQQSLHDGTKWRHQPIRLNVYIAAPKKSINLIIQKHPMVKELIENHWLFLFQWNYETKTIWAYNNGSWKKVKESSSHHLSKSIEIYGKKIEMYKKRIEINGEIFETDDYNSIGDLCTKHI